MREHGTNFPQVLRHSLPNLGDSLAKTPLKSFYLPTEYYTCKHSITSVNINPLKLFVHGDSKTMVDRPDISTSEWQVMNVVWKQQPVTASAIIKQLAPTNEWTPATVRTFLHRLVKKGALTFEKDGNRYLYRAAVTRAATIKHASRSFLSSCLLYTSPSPRDATLSRMPSSA